MWSGFSPPFPGYILKVFKMTYHAGDYYVICDLCGFKKLRSKCRKTWDNLIVCSDTCYDGPRNPQDYKVKPKADRQAVRDARPEQEDVFISDIGDVGWDDL